MKTKLLLSLLLLSCYFTKAQTGLHTSDKYLLDPCGDTVLLRGIDYAPYNWGYDNTSSEFSQIRQTGANCVRMPWYKSNAAPYYTNNLLDSALTNCFANNMIPIIELHDQTCDNDTDALIELANWYTDSSVLAILQKHQAYLIIDIANEALYHNWANDPTAAAITYTNTYNTIITNLRTAGLTMPLMIDAPDCGTDITLFSTVASTIVNNDPLHNVLFSAHAYWYSYASNDSIQADALINTASGLHVPVLLGEFANYQSDQTACEYVLPYQALLRSCQRYNFPWLCWSWDNDQCADRQLSSNGNYSSLTTYGNDIILNSIYGLQTQATRTNFFTNGGNCITTGIENITAAQKTLITYPLAEGILGLRSLATQQIIITDITGKEIYSGTLRDNEQKQISLIPGMYLVQSNKQPTIKTAVY